MHKRADLADLRLLSPEKVCLQDWSLSGVSEIPKTTTGLKIHQEDPWGSPLVVLCAVITVKGYTKSAMQIIPGVKSKGNQAKLPEILMRFPGRQHFMCTVTV